MMNVRSEVAFECFLHVFVGVSNVEGSDLLVEECFRENTQFTQTTLLKVTSLSQVVVLQTHLCQQTLTSPLEIEVVRYFSKQCNLSTVALFNATSLRRMKTTQEC